MNAIGSSGTILSVGLLVNSIKVNLNFKEFINNFKFTFADLLNIEKKILSSEKIDDRVKIIGLDPKEQK